MKITYYLNFKEDQRISMDIYANQTIEYLKKNYQDFNIHCFRPKIDFISSIIPNNIFKMRYARYISYPKQVKNLIKSDIAHIFDHQYAHLYSALNSKIKFITVHDLVPFIFAKKRGKSPHLLSYSFSKLKYFSKVIAVSENTKKDILKYTDCPEDKIIVTMEAIEDFFNDFKINEAEICKKYNLPNNKKKILIHGTRAYTGKSNYFIKNSQISFQILEKLIKLDQDIIFINLGGKLHMNNFNHLKNYVFSLPFLNREEIPNIYKICKLLLYPSIYEGFGRPLLEAMQCGIPIVCSNNSSIPEVVGDVAFTNDHDNVEGFVKDIINFLTDKKLYLLKQQKALERAKKFDITKIHNNLIDIYRAEINKLD